MQLDQGQGEAWRDDDEGVIELVQHLKCLPLAIWQVTAYARVHGTATAGEHLAALQAMRAEGGAGKGD
jgi:hypothetical protein